MHFITNKTWKAWVALQIAIIFANFKCFSLYLNLGILFDSKLKSYQNWVLFQRKKYYYVNILNPKLTMSSDTDDNPWWPPLSKQASFDLGSTSSKRSHNFCDYNYLLTYVRTTKKRGGVVHMIGAVFPNLFIWFPKKVLVRSVIIFLQ